MVRRIKVSLCLRGNVQSRLQVGGGRHIIKGWLNGDIVAGDIYLDVTKRMPFPDESFQYVFAEQFLEHLTFNEARRFLSESHRVIEEDGVLRLAVPDLELLAQLYCDKNHHVVLQKAMTRHKTKHNSELTTRCHFINDFFRLWGHKFIYDEETLRYIMRNTGFSNITRCQFGESKYGELENKERHADVEWMKYSWLLMLEGTKV